MVVKKIIGEVKDKLDALGLKDVPYETMEAIVLCDDFFSFLKKPWEMVKKVWNHPLSKNIVESLLNSAGAVYPQSKIVKAGKFFYDMANNSTVEEETGLSRRTQAVIGFDTVSGASLASFFCPEMYKARMSYDTNLPTTLVNISFPFNLTTNANGNVRLIFAPHKCFAGSMIWELNGATFNPITGLQTSASAQMSGCFTNIAANFKQYRMSSFSVVFTPTASVLNTQGQVRCCYLTTAAPYNTTMNAPVVTATDIEAGTMFQKASLTSNKELTYTHWLSDNNDTLFADVDTSSNQAPKSTITFDVWGAVPNTMVAVTTITMVAETCPTSSNYTMFTLEMADPGPATEKLIYLVQKSFPELLMADLPFRSALAARLQYATTYDEAYQIVSSTMSFSGKQE